MNNFKENVKNKLEKVNFKKIIKISAFSLLGFGIAGGGAAYAYKTYDDAQEAKARQAQTTIIKNQASQNNINLKSEDEVKSAVSKVIGVDTTSITFDEIYLTDVNEKSKDSKKNKFSQEKYSNKTITNTTTKSEETNSDSANSDSANSTENSSEKTSTSETNNTTTTSTTKYIYKVKAQANSLDYVAYVDAENGEVISVRVKN